MAIEIRGLAPLVEVFDMPASLAFYRDKLGFRVTGDSGQGDESGWVMLELCGATLMLNTAYDEGMRPAREDPARVAAHRDTCIYFACPDVDAAYEHLKANNIECDPPSVAQYGMKQLYLTDPDNYGLCFQSPADEENRRDRAAGEGLWQQTKQALDRGDFSVLDDLLIEANVSVIDLLEGNDAPSNYWEEALTWACFTGRTAEARALLDRGVDPAAGTSTGMAAFHWAANRGNLETVKLLIERRAPLEQKNRYDGTVLGCTLWSAIHEHRESHAAIVDALVEAGAEFDAEWLDWWNKQDVRSTVTKQRISSALERIRRT